MTAPPTVSTAKLDAALNLIPLAACDRLGKSLHDAGYPLTEWLQWCEFRADSKADYARLATECAAAWEQFPGAQKSRNPQAVFELAQEFGWKPDPGSVRTEANRKSAARALAWDLADELDLPPRLRNDNPERDDLARLCHYGAADLRVVQGERCYIALPSGYWTPVHNTGGVHAGALAELLDRVRADAVAEASTNPQLVEVDYPATLAGSWRSSMNHVRQVSTQLDRVIADPFKYDVTSIALVNFDNRRAHPVVPLTGGGAIDLTSGDPLTPTQIKSLMLLDHGWGINYRPELLEPGVVPDAEDGIAHYGKPLIRRLALHLLGESKSIDSINFPVSDSGKGTLIDWMTAGFPKMVDTLDATKVFKARGEDFAHVTDPLTRCIWVFFDECDKVKDVVDGVPADRINTLTNTLLDVRRMQRDAVRVPRIGTPIMTGADWLPFDSSAQGALTRWSWAYYAERPPQSAAWHDTLVSGDCPDFLAAYIVREAIDLYQRGDDTITAEVRQTVAEMLHHNANDLASTMREVVVKSDRKEDTVVVAEIKRMLAEAGLPDVDKIHSKQLDSAIRRVSPRSMSQRVTGGGTKRTHLRLAGSEPTPPATECPECGGDNGGRPMTDIGICINCELKE